MKVLLTYTSYPQQENDWRGRFIFDLVHALAKQSEIALRLWGPSGPIPDNVVYTPNQRTTDWLRSLLDKGGIAHLLRRHPIQGIATALRLLLLLKRTHRENQDVDVAHINWLQNALGLLGTRTPALVSVLGTDFKLLDTPGIVPLLRLVLRQRRCILAPNGAWMVETLNRLFGDIAKIEYVPFGVDKRWFLVRRTAQQQPRRWLVVVRVTTAKIGPLFEWGADLFRNGDELHLLGPKQEGVVIPDWVQYHGPTNPDALADEWYPKATGMISLSEHSEGRPQVLVEAMAAGLPVIASNLLAHQDLVKHRDTGWLVNSPQSFRDALQALSDPQTNTEYGTRAQNWIKEHIGTWSDTAERYTRLYRELTKLNA